MLKKMLIKDIEARIRSLEKAIVTNPHIESISKDSCQHIDM